MPQYKNPASKCRCKSMCVTAMHNDQRLQGKIWTTVQGQIKKASIQRKIKEKWIIKEKIVSNKQD